MNDLYLDHVDKLRRYHESLNFELSPSVWAEIAPEEVDTVSEMLLSRYDRLAEIKIHIEKDLTEVKYKDEETKMLREVFLEISLAEEAVKIQEEINWLSRYMANFVPVSDVITETDIENARNVPLERLIGEYKLKSGRLFTKCPFHEENTPSFVVFKTNKYHCFGCGANGSVIDYVMKTQKLNFIETIKYLNKL